MTVADTILLYQRGVEPQDACPDCHGWGRKTYGNTSTWSHGIGGQAMTSDVCDKCWGSGNINRPGLNLRLFTLLGRAIREVHDKYHPALLGIGVAFEECKDPICMAYQAGVRK